jgi:hypothetical protein
VVLFFILVMGTFWRRGSSAEILWRILVPSCRVRTAQYTLFLTTVLKTWFVTILLNVEIHGVRDKLKK